MNKLTTFIEDVTTLRDLHQRKLTERALLRIEVYLNELRGCIEPGRNKILNLKMQLAFLRLLNLDSYFFDCFERRGLLFDLRHSNFASNFRLNKLDFDVALLRFFFYNLRENLLSMRLIIANAHLACGIRRTNAAVLSENARLAIASDLHFEIVIFIVVPNNISEIQR